MADRSTSSSQLVEVLDQLRSVDSETLLDWPALWTRIPDFLDHRDERVHALSAVVVRRFSQLIAQLRADFVDDWRSRVDDLLKLDRRTNRFVHAYPRVKRVLECLASVGEWKIQDDDNELAYFIRNMI